MIQYNLRTLWGKGLCNCYLRKMNFNHDPITFWNQFREITCKSDIFFFIIQWLKQLELPSCTSTDSYPVFVLQENAYLVVRCICGFTIHGRYKMIYMCYLFIIHYWSCLPVIFDKTYSFKLSNDINNIILIYTCIYDYLLVFRMQHILFVLYWRHATDLHTRLLPVVTSFNQSVFYRSKTLSKYFSVKYLRQSVFATPSFVGRSTLFICHNFKLTNRLSPPFWKI